MIEERKNQYSGHVDRSQSNRQKDEDYFDKRRDKYPETTKVFSPNISEQMDGMVTHKDSTVSYIKAVESENSAFRNETRRIEKDMQALQSLMNKLVQQNQNLREHYYQRNRDIQNIIHTIRVNLGVEITDINHHIHLLREGNCVLFKSIQAEIKNQRDFEERIGNMGNKLLELKRETVDMEETKLFPIKARLQSKLNKKKIQELTQDRDRLAKAEEKLTEQINVLVIEINQLKKNNIQGMRHERTEKQNISKDKENLKGNIVNTLKSLQQLKTDIAQQVSSLALQTQAKNQLSKILHNVEEQATRRNISQQKKMTHLNKLLSSRQDQLKHFDKTRISTSQLQIQIMKKTEEKDQILKQLTAKRQQLHRQAQVHYENKCKKEEQKNSTVSRIRIKIEEIQVEGKKEEKAYEQDMKDIEENIRGLEGELTELDGDRSYHEQLVTKIENPTKQLQKQQVKQKLSQTRKSLFNRQC